VILSLNEIEATILKAARGAGMEWGLAEEAAQAARWLACRGLLFERGFLGILEAKPWDAEITFAALSLRPCDSQTWLCPIRAGACLSDLAVMPPWRIERVMQPLLLLPFVARLSAPVTLTWGDVSLSPGDPRFDAWHIGGGTPSGDRAEIVELVASGTLPGTQAKPKNGVEIDPTIWPRIQAFEARTYVPASLHSRLSGAGSAAGDND
jgi:hypothetical protein